jgi:hypothetical protein
LLVHQPRRVVDDLAAAALLELLELGPRHVVNAVYGARVDGFFDDLVRVALWRAKREGAWREKERTRVAI